MIYENISDDDKPQPTTPTTVNGNGQIMNFPLSSLTATQLRQPRVSSSSTESHSGSSSIMSGDEAVDGEIRQAMDVEAPVPPSVTEATSIENAVVHEGNAMMNESKFPAQNEDDEMRTMSPTYSRGEETRTDTPLSPEYCKEEETRMDTPQSPDFNGHDTMLADMEHTDFKHVQRNMVAAAQADNESTDNSDDSIDSDSEFDEDDIEEDEDEVVEELQKKHQFEIKIYSPDSRNIYYVKRDDKDGAKVYPVKVLQSRPAKTPSEFYVHYVGHDRRQDEWVPRDRIGPDAEYFGKNCVPESMPGVGQIVLTVDLESLSLCDKKFSRTQRSLEGFHDRDDQTEQEHQNLTAVKFITTLQFGGYSINTWYYSPFPNEYEKVSQIFVCQYCMRYMSTFDDLCYHEPQCNMKEPPGKIVYEKDDLAIYEVFGKDNVIYCQCLCLMAKLFLDHKALFFDVAPFTFYILCQTDDEGAHMVGYFSKEADSVDNNLACLLIIPPYQRRGYGKLLIGFSYELSRRDGTSGSPEKPLSDMGRLSYRSFWGYTILTLLHATKKISISEIVRLTGIAREDVLFTLNILNMIKYWADERTICIHPDSIKSALEFRQYRKPQHMVDPARVRYTPPKKKF